VAAALQSWLLAADAQNRERSVRPCLIDWSDPSDRSDPSDLPGPLRHSAAVSNAEQAMEQVLNTLGSVIFLRKL